MRKPKNVAKLNKSEVETEIYRRTGLPEEAIRVVINTYGEIIKECLINQVQVAFADIGVFCLQHKPAKAFDYYYDIKQKQWVTWDEPKLTPGYDSAIFKVNNSMKQFMRENTIPLYEHELKELEEKIKENKNGRNGDSSDG